MVPTSDMLALRASRDCFILVSNTQDGDLSVFHFDAARERLRLAGRYEAGPAVMPLAIAAEGRTVYAATRGEAPMLVRFAFDPRDGRLTREHAVRIDAGLAYLAVGRTGRHLFGASYHGHCVVSYSTALLDDTPDGALLSPRQILPGIRNAHAIELSADERFAYAASLGGDQIICYRIDAHAPKGPLTHFDTLTLDTGFGPRHLRLSPCGEWLHVLSEFRATIATLHRDRASGRIAAHSVSPRSPALAGLRDKSGHSNASASAQSDPATPASLTWAADIHIRPDGHFVYLSERTTSRLIVLRVDEDGTLQPAGHSDTATQPRGFRIDPTGTLLLACGERATQVHAYRIDAESGALVRCAQCDGGRGASWVEIIPCATA